MKEKGIGAKWPQEVCKVGVLFIIPPKNNSF